MSAALDFPRPFARSWWLEFDNDGWPVMWSGWAADENAAETIARQALAAKHADFDPQNARLIACLER